MRLRSSREDDDDRSRGAWSRGTLDHGQGGWFGDPEGHSEASRKGWEGRGMSRVSSHRMSRYDDDDEECGGSSRNIHWRGRGNDEDRGVRSSRSASNRGQSGWFGDSEGHSEASRRRWQYRD